MATSEANANSKVFPSGVAPFRALPGEGLVGDEATAQVIAEILVGEGLDLDEATKKFRGRGGVPMAKSTIGRHINHGVRLPDGTRVFLASAKFGSKIYTSFPAITRFMLAITPAITSTPPPTTSANTTPDARRVKKATEKLVAAGA